MWMDKGQQTRMEVPRDKRKGQGKKAEETSFQIEWTRETSERQGQRQSTSFH